VCGFSIIYLEIVHEEVIIPAIQKLLVNDQFMFQLTGGSTADVVFHIVTGIFESNDSIGFLDEYRRGF
jgi:hypothetical protein